MPNKDSDKVKAFRRRLSTALKERRPSCMLLPRDALIVIGLTVLIAALIALSFYPDWRNFAFLWSGILAGGLISAYFTSIRALSHTLLIEDELLNLARAAFALLKQSDKAALNELLNEKLKQFKQQRKEGLTK